MIVQLKIAGALMMILALIHLVFPVYFKWKQELQSLSLVNREMVFVHTFFIALTVFLMGLLCVGCAADLTDTALGKKIALGMSLFWCCRLVIQFVGYSASLWKGKQFETIVHIIFSLLWIYFTLLFFCVGFL